MRPSHWLPSEMSGGNGGMVRIVGFFFFLAMGSRTSMG
jgi:hypothetical protein